MDKRTGLKDKMRRIAMIFFPYMCSTIHAAITWEIFRRAVDDNELGMGHGFLFDITHFDWRLGALSTPFFALNILLADLTFVSTLFTLY